MIKSLLKVSALFFAGFIVGVYCEHKRLAKHSDERVSLLGSGTDSPVKDFIYEENLDNEETVIGLIRDNMSDDGQFLFTHPNGKGCYLCEKLDVVGVTVDQSSYNHTFRKQDGNVYHFLRREPQ